MARSMWKGVISFGMVAIPVRLYIATESHGVSFRQLCRAHHQPINYKRWCAAGDHEVTQPEIVKGYEVGRDRYVEIGEEDLENLPLNTNHTIDILEFVPADDISGGLYFKSAYYVEPEETGRKPYALLSQALEHTNRLAVAKIALRDREHLCSLQPMEGVVLLNTLHWPDEIRPTSEIKRTSADGLKIDPRELKMAVSLIESLADSFDPERYQDQYREALMQVVTAKMDGEKPVAPTGPAAATQVMDLMEALKASVENAKKQRQVAPARPARRRKAS